MVTDKISYVADQLREFLRFADDEYVYLPVSISRSVEFDLGQFGYVETEVELEDEDAEINPRSLIDKFSVDYDELQRLIDDLDQIVADANDEPERPESSIDELLARIERDEGGAPLAKALRAVIEMASPVQKNAQGYPMGYDPVTVPVAQYPSKGVPTTELRLGDDITGDDFGRLVGVQRVNADEVELTMNRNGEINVTTDSLTTTWEILMVVGVERDAVPPALEGLVPSLPGLTYDPETIAVEDRSIMVTPKELRLGDLITGAYGKVLSVKKATGTMYDYVVLTESRKRREFRDNRSDWAIRPIVTPNRQDIPAAVDLLSGYTLKADGAPPERPRGVEYDPLTVPTKQRPESVLEKDLRLGDNIVGPSFGRVIGFTEDGTQLILNRDGTERKLDSSPDRRWSIDEIDVPDRDAVPTALTLTVKPF